MIRLIATDLDDTLLNAAHDVTARTLRAVRAAMEAGVMISLSSGRMPEGMIPFAEKLGVNAPMILFNGGLIYDHRTDQTLFSNAIPAAAAREVAKTLEEMGVYVQAYPGKGFYCNRKCDHTFAYERQIHVIATELGIPVSEWIQTDMIKMLAISTPDRITEVQAHLKEKFPTGVNFFKSKPHFLEIVSEGIDKGRALLTLGEKLGIDREEIMAFGDGQNDATMIAAAGCGVAVENAVEECKRNAKIIAPRNTQDGVAQIIEQFLSEGKFGRS